MWQLFLHLPDHYLFGMLIWIAALTIAPVLMLRLRRRWKERPRLLKLIPASLSLWSLLAFLTAVEIGFALLYDTTDAFDASNVSHRWFDVHVSRDLKPLEFSDGMGIHYRDDQRFPEAPDARTHICFVGDSFTFGHGVPDVRHRFSNRLRHQLEVDDETKGRFIVSNLSKPGGDLVWIQALVKHLVSTKRGIDEIVYVICLNDIESFHPEFQQKMKDHQNMKSVPEFFLIRDTYFFNWLWYRFNQVARREMQDYYSYVRSYYDGAPWQRYLVELRRLKAICRTQDVRLSVAVFPFLHNLDDEYPFRPVHQQIADGCRSLDIRCIDLEPDLAAHAGTTLTVNPFDAHPNEFAHEIAAATLYRELMRATGPPLTETEPGASLESPPGD